MEKHEHWNGEIAHLNQDRERRRLRLERRKRMEDAHREWLRDVSLMPLFSGIGREETFTGLLLASLLNPLSRPIVLRGLGIPEELQLTSATADALPIDLVLGFIDGENRELPIAIEVKWADSNSNYPGYRKDVKGQPAADDAPSQLDRAHQLTQMTAFTSDGKVAPTECSHCGYPNVCPSHGCLRGCSGDGGESNLPWTDRPEIYPKPVKESTPHWWERFEAAPENWTYILLDYDGRPAYKEGGGGAFVGVCSDAWRTSSMEHLAQTLRDHYNEHPTASDARSLEPLLVALFAR